MHTVYITVLTFEPPHGGAALKELFVVTETSVERARRGGQGGGNDQRLPPAPAGARGTGDR